MKKSIVFLVLTMSLVNFSAFSQTEKDDAPLLNLPGDNLDLYAVLTLFQKSKTIEAFEKSLNEEQTKINNLDLNLDKKVDFIKVVTEQKDKDFTFILQVDVTEKEKQDVAAILVSKDKDGKVTMQIVGDPDLYGKDYVIEPQPAAPPVTPNPGYTGSQPVVVTAAPTTTIIVESAPIVQYVYSPAYVPYYPPYYYAYYPPYFAAFTVMAIGIYRHNNYYYHGGYHGGHGNNTVIINNKNFNNYNRNTSNTVNNNMAKGNYKGSNSGSMNNRASTNNLSNNKASNNNLNNNKASNNNLSNNRASSNNMSNSKAPTNTRSSPSSSMHGGGRSMSGGMRSGGGGRRR